MFVVMCGNNQSVNVRELITYIPLTQFEVTIVSYGPGFFLWPLKKNKRLSCAVWTLCVVEGRKLYMHSWSIAKVVRATDISYVFLITK